MIAQIRRHDEIADTYEVQPHDLQGTAAYYLADIKAFKYPAALLDRCTGIAGGLVDTKCGSGTIITVVNPETENGPYRYYVQLKSGVYKVFTEQRPL